MLLQQLGVSGFRNLHEAHISLAAPLVAFVGPNGQGKTNLLEAVGVLGLLKSFRTARLQELAGWGRPGFSVEGQGQSEGMTRTWRFTMQEGERALRRDGKAVAPTAWLTSMRACHFTPEDTALIRGEPSLRRALLDRAVFTVEPGHLEPVQVWRRLSAHKTALLRQPSPDRAQLEIIDEQLIQSGLRIMEGRASTMRLMVPIFERTYGEFTGQERAEVRYRPSLGDDPARWEERWRAELAEKGEEEIRRGRCLVGPQRDELLFRIGAQGDPQGGTQGGTQGARAFASQGQSRSLVLAWKLAEVEVARAAGEAPLFLMDDLGSELDPSRTEQLVRLLRGLGAQIFVTTTDVRYLPSGATDAIYYKVDQGRATLLAH